MKTVSKGMPRPLPPPHHLDPLPLKGVCDKQASRLGYPVLAWEIPGYQFLQAITPTSGPVASLFLWETGPPGERVVWARHYRRG